MDWPHWAAHIGRMQDRAASTWLQVPRLPHDMQQVAAQSGCRPPGVHCDSMQVNDGMQKVSKAQAS
jgi:hypothetical protein